MMQNQRLRASLIMDELLLYGERLLGIKTDNHLCRKDGWWYLMYFSVTRSGITYIAPKTIGDEGYVLIPPPTLNI